MAVYQYSRVLVFDSLGGPTVADPKQGATPTRAGRFVIGSIGKHKSSSRWAMSTIEFGTPMRNEKGLLQIQQQGKWKDISSLPSFMQFKGQEAQFTKWLQEQYQKSYKDGLKGKLSPAEWNKPLPDSWVFNDFGHIAVKYFRDTNGNFVRDKKEPVMSDFIHTIPVDEFYTKHGAKYPMVESHGCIHMHPDDIDEALKHIKIGSVIEVHPYTDLKVPLSFERSFGHPRYELHFFPAKQTSSGAGVVAIYSVTKR